MYNSPYCFAKQLRTLAASSGTPGAALMPSCQFDANRLGCTRSCPGEWCNSGEAIAISGKARLIKLSRRRAA